ncbi:GIY-YIG nuclease family protein [Kangiella japonica]|uniref:GIY-YIG nuclease family protein n=1 Tax=Kangiella japonica TaxID=647384 RepID=A0ABP3CHF4_9GAMM
MKEYYVYILASRKDGVLYIGVTGDLLKRIYQHQQGAIEGFTKKYQVKKLVYFESCNNINVCLNREKQLKAWRRDWKVALIEANNPNWNDLSDGLYN